MCRRFGLVQEATLSPANQLRQDLYTLGWDSKCSVTVNSDEEATLPNLVFSAVRQPIRHILDWWHNSMRVQHVENTAKGLLKAENFPGIPELFQRPAETLRWHLWHGKIQTVGTLIQCLMVDCARLRRMNLLCVMRLRECKRVGGNFIRILPTTWTT